MNLRKIIILLGLALCLPFSAIAQKPEPADFVYTGGKIYTVNKKQPWAEAIAVKGNEIVYVGDDAGSKAFIGDKTQVNDLGGKFVMPGIIATHEHSIFYMITSSGLNISELSHDKNKMLAEVKQYLKKNPDGPYYSFGGAYEKSVEIRREDLDAITGPDRPFFMYAQTGHGGWANSKALEQAGVKKGAEDPIDFFGRDEDGTPNGYVGSAAAGNYMFGVAGIDKDAMKREAPAIMDQIAEAGITHVLEAGQPPGQEDIMFAAIGELEKEGKLKVRMNVAVFVQRAFQAENGIKALKKYSKIYDSDFFRVNFLKIHGDGALEGHTAYLLDDYSDKPGERGILSLPEDKAIEVALEATKNGFHMHTHAIGDGATRSFLNVFEAVRKAGYDKPRLTMGHTVMVTDEDLPRFKDLNVTANFYNWEAAQPNPDYLKRLGPKRYPRLLMRQGSLLASGARVSFSQDWPTAPIDPFLHIHAAVTRSHIGKKEILGSEKDKVTLAQAIRAYTLDSAYALGTEDQDGSIEVGKWADFIILDRNPFEIPEDELPEVKVLRTVLDGRVVFDRAEKMGKKDVVKVKVTNPDLQSAIDIEQLNLLVEDELQAGVAPTGDYGAVDYTGSRFAPDEVNKAFAVLAEKGYNYARPARAIYWKNTDSIYWIQWTLKDDVAVLWAFDPKAGKAVEILEVRDK